MKLTENLDRLLEMAEQDLALPGFLPDPAGRKMHKMVQDLGSTILGEKSRLSGGFTWYKYEKSTSQRYKGTKKEEPESSDSSGFQGYFLT